MGKAAPFLPGPLFPPRGPPPCMEAAKQRWRTAPHDSSALVEEAPPDAPPPLLLTASAAAAESLSDVASPTSGSTIQASGASRKSFRKGDTSSQSASYASRGRDSAMAASADAWRARASTQSGEWVPRAKAERTSGVGSQEAPRPAVRWRGKRQREQDQNDGRTKRGRSPSLSISLIPDAPPRSPLRYGRP